MVDNSARSTARTPVIDAPPGRQRWGELAVHTHVKMLLVVGLVCWVFRGELARLVQDWVNDKSWSHGFLIPLFSLYLLNQRKVTLLNLRLRPNYLGLPLMIVVFGFYFLNLISPSGYAYFRQLSIIWMLGAVVLLLGGWELVKHTWLPIGFLIFAVPFPRRYYVALTWRLQQLSAAAAGFFLQLVNEVETSVSGVVIDVIYRGRHLEPKLNVAEACSGMRLLMAFVALGVAMAYIHYRPLWQRLVLLASTIPIAVLCNIVRVTVTGFIFVFIGPRYTQDIYHDALGIAMLPLAFVFYGLLGWFMSSLFVEDGRLAGEQVVISRKKK